MPFCVQALDSIKSLVGFITSRFQETARVYDHNIGILRIGTHESGWFCSDDLPKHGLAVSQVLCAPQADHADSRPTVYSLANHTQES